MCGYVCVVCVCEQEGSSECVCRRELMSVCVCVCLGGIQ